MQASNMGEFLGSLQQTLGEVHFGSNSATRLLAAAVATDAVVPSCSWMRLAAAAGRCCSLADGALPRGGARLLELHKMAALGPIYLLFVLVCFDAAACLFLISPLGSAGWSGKEDQFFALPAAATAEAVLAPLLFLPLPPYSNAPRFIPFGALSRWLVRCCC